MDSPLIRSPSVLCALLLLAGVIRAGEPDPVRHAVAALGRLDTDPQAHVELRFLYDNAQAAQRAAILGEIGAVGAREVWPLVADAMGERDPLIVAAALRTGALLGFEEAEQLAAVRTLLAHEDPRVQDAAAAAVVAAEDETAIPELLARLARKPPEATATICMLRRLGGPDPGEDLDGWKAWYEAEAKAADKRFDEVCYLLRAKERERVIEGLRQATGLRLRRGDLAPVLAPFAAAKDPELARLSTSVLVLLGGVQCDQVRRTAAEARPVEHDLRTGLEPVPPPPPVPLTQTTRDWLTLIAVATVPTLVVLWVIWWAGRIVVTATARFVRKMMEKRKSRRMALSSAAPPSEALERRKASTGGGG